MKIAFVFNRKTNQTIEQAEFDTDETIQAISNALKKTGHEVFDVEMSLERGMLGWTSSLVEIKPDIVFNTAEGFYGVGRESLGPTFFEQLQIPYVGSGPYGCFLTLDKFLTKQMVASRKVPVIEGYFINSNEDLNNVLPEIVFPVFVKPNYEGSSKGITSRSICRNIEELLGYGQECLRSFPQGILIEKYIAGRDVSVAFLGGLGDSGVLEPYEYVYGAPDKKEFGIYDYELKNQLDEGVSVKCPASLEPNQRNRLVEMMKRIVSVLGIVDFARADFRISNEGDIYFLEINALPSLQPGAGLFDATKLLGLNYEQTIQKVFESALSRLKLNGKYVKSPRRLLHTRHPKIGLVYNLKRKRQGEFGYEAEAEFDSPSTVTAIQSTIEKFGCQVVPIEATKSLAESLKEHRIDVVFNIAEGTNKRAREAQVPAICDLLGIEHTGSDATCLALTLDKAITKKLLSQDGILTPNYLLITQSPKLDDFNLKFPVIVKPNTEGTSKGIGSKSVARDLGELKVIAGELWKTFLSPILIEEYIEGREFTVGVLGNSSLRVLGPMEITFKSDSGQYPVYSFEAKQHADPSNNPFFAIHCPVNLGRELDRKISQFAKKIFLSLGCRDVARIDFRVDKNGGLFFLEINPLPGLSPGFSDLTVMAEKCGISYEFLIKRILTPSIQRWRNIGKLKNI